MNKIIILLVLGFAALAMAHVDLDDLKKEMENDEVFQKLIKKYKTRSSNPEDGVVRYRRFRKAKAEVERHNEAFLRGEVSYEKGLNQFSVMSTEEKRKIASLVVPENPAEGVEHFRPKRQTQPATAIPLTFNWVTRGKVTRVKDQKDCGSCWTYGTTGVLEGYLAIQSNSNATELSEQHLLDCVDSEHGSRGCDGGWPPSALQWVAQNGGISRNNTYASGYLNQKSVCRNDRTRIVPIRFSRIVQAPQTEAGLQSTLVNVGPLTAAINACSSFMTYKSGVYSDPKCNDGSVNHAVLLVGYGTDPNTRQKFWLLKNTWGTNWGERGYFRLLRGPDTIQVQKYAYGVRP